MKAPISGLTILAGLMAVGAVQAATLGDQLVGTWACTEAATHEAGGKTSYPYGKSPKGEIIFTKDGHFIQIMTTGDLPKFASNKRTAGTPEEYKAVVEKSLAFFGTYSVDEAKKLVTYKVDTSTFPNWDGVTQPRTIVKLTADEFIYKKSGASAGGDAENTFKRVGK